MNNNEYQQILELLKSMNRLDLVTKQISNRSFEEIKKILLMPEWKEDRFKKLLTLNIWNSNYEEIKKILLMPEWESEKYKNLLTSTININYMV